MSEQPDPATALRPGRMREVRRGLTELRGRVWELELLLSGAVLFALLQAPPRVDRMFWSLEGQLGDAAHQGWFLSFYYLRLVLYTLIAAFLLHLVLRSFWIALIGLESAYPRGIRWGELRAGPIARDLLRKMLPSLRRQVLAADTAASIVFAFAFSVALLFLLSIPLFAGVGLLALAIAPRLGLEVELATLVVAYLGLAVVIALGLLDRLRGEQLLERPGRLASTVRGGLRAWYRFAAIRWYGPTLLTLQTNLGRRFLPLFLLTFSVGIGIFLVRDVALGNDLVRAGGAGYRPDDPGAHGFEIAHYEDRRPPGPYARAASIPSEIVDGPYLRLFVPLHPERTRAGMAASCPGVEPLPGGAVRPVGRSPEPPPPERLDELLGCLGRLHRVELDGTPLDGLEWAFYELPEAGAHGLAAFLPTAGLAPGRHLLTVRREPLPDADDEPPPVQHIPFLR